MDTCVGKILSCDDKGVVKVSSPPDALHEEKVVLYK
jgi:hypothetical protein